MPCSTPPRAAARLASFIRLFLLACAALTLYPAPLLASDVRIGVLANRGAEKCLDEWSDMAERLNKAIPWRHAVIVPLAFEQVGPTIADKKIDFLIANPSMYAEMEMTHYVMRIATLKNYAHGKSSSYFGGVVFCKADRDDIRSLADLKGKRFVATHRDSLGGWHAAWGEFKKLGIDPFKDFSAMDFAGTHDAAAHAVLADFYDAGTVRTDTLERLAEVGEISLDSVKILQGPGVGKGPEYQQFPFVFSTRLYPEWPIAKLAHTSDEVAREVAAALLGLPELQTFQDWMKVKNWTVPLNYEPIHELMKALRYGPYANYGKVGLAEAIAQHWLTFLLLLSALLLVLAFSAYLRLLNSRLNAAHAKLVGELAERTRAESALKRSEKQIRAMLDATSDSVFLLTAEGRILEANENAARRRHVPVAELRGKSITHALPEKSAQDRRDYIGQVLMTRHDAVFEDEREGRYFSVRITPIFDETGAVIQLASFSRDMTESRAAEAGLRASEQRFRELFHDAALGILITDEQGVVLDANPYACALMNRPMEQYRGLKPEEQVHPEDLAVFSLFPRSAASDAKRVVHMERRYKASNGEYIPVEVVVSTLRGAGDTLIMFMDIRERRRREAERRREATLNAVMAQLSQRLLAAASFSELARLTMGAAQRLTESPLGLAGYLPPGGSRLLCPSASGMLAAPPTPDNPLCLETSAPFWRLTVERKAPVFYNNAQEFAQSGLPAAQEPWRRVLAAPALQGDSLLGAILVANAQRDYTEEDARGLERLAALFSLGLARARIEEQLVQARVAAEAANRAKGEFLANMSHEIRTPLNGVLGMLQVLTSSSLPKEERDCASLALQAAKNLLFLLNDILDLSRIEADRLELKPEPFRLVDALLAVENVFRPACKEKGLELSFVLDERLPAFMLGDEARIRQILFNLVGNALKFTQKGGVRVEASRLPSRNDSESNVLFQISDTGVGIPDEKQDIIFDRFTQSEATASKRFQGAGLGLAIVKRLVLMMGGAIAVDSELGKGTTMFVTLRLRHAAPELLAPSAATPAAAPSACEALRILVAEDDATNRIALQRFLERMGHTPRLACNGVEALQLLREEPFDLILMDIQMPELNGLEATRRLRADSTLGDKARIPIIALTAYVRQDDREAMLAAGMQLFVAKPVDFEELREAIASLAPSRS